MIDPIAEKERELFTRTHALNAYRKGVPFNRDYALDLRGLNELGALALAYRDVTEHFDERELAKLFGQLAEVEPSLRQDRPAPEEETPKVPVDEATGFQPINPWMAGHENLTEQQVIAKRDPKLAKHLEAIAQGISYSFLYKQIEQRERNEKLRQLKYTEQEHKSNPFHLTGKEGLNAQSVFVNVHKDEAHLIEFYRREATEPVTLNYSKLTPKMLATKKDPLLGKVFMRAVQIHSQWLKDDTERLEAEVKKSARQVEWNKQQLAGVR